MKVRICMIVCKPECDYGALIESWLRRSVPVEVAQLAFEEFNASLGALPSVDAAAQFDAVVVSGSPSSAYEDVDWVKTLGSRLQLIVQTNAEAKVFGICFGHQILAHYLGGRCERNNAGSEMGCREIALTEEGRKFLCGDGNDGDREKRVFLLETHSDIVTQLPPGAVLGAKNNRGTQMFLLGKNVVGVQGHPEFTPEKALKSATGHARKGLITKEYFEESAATIRDQKDGGDDFGKAFWRWVLENKKNK